MPLAIFALTIAAYAIGTTEFVIVGLLPTVASDDFPSTPEEIQVRVDSRQRCWALEVLQPLPVRALE